MGDGDDILLELTKKHLNIGLRGVPVGTCRTSFVTPEQGVHYCGYPIKDLSELRAEDVVYLLFHKEKDSLLFDSLNLKDKIPPQTVMNL